MTLLHYIVDVAEIEKPSLLDFINELSSVKQASRLNVDTLKAELQVLEKNVHELQTHLDKNPDDLADLMKGNSDLYLIKNRYEIFCSFFFNGFISFLMEGERTILFLLNFRFSRAS